MSIHTRRRDYLAVLTLIVLALPFLVWLINLSQQANTESEAREVVVNFTDESGTRLTNFEYREVDNTIVLRAYIESVEPITPEQVQAVQDALTAQVERTVRLEVVVQPVIIAQQP